MPRPPHGAPVRRQGSIVAAARRAAMLGGVILALALLAAVTAVVPLHALAAASPFELMDLSGEWKLEAGDDPSWADPQLRDDAWATVTLPDADAHGAVVSGHEIAWYRKTVELSLAGRREPAGQRFALLVPPVAGAYEAFVNGTKVGARGDLDPGGRIAPFAFEVFSIPWTAPAAESTVLALRIRTPAGIRSHPVGFGRMAYGAPALGPETVVRQAALAKLKTFTLERQVPRAGVVLLLLLLGVYHLHLFWRRPQLRAYLWYGALLVFAGATEGTPLVYQGQWVSWLDLETEKHFNVFNTLVMATQIEFVFVFLYQRPPGRLCRALQGLVLLEGLAYAIAGASTTLLLPWLLRALLELTATFLPAVAVLWAAIRHRSTDARVIAGGYALFIVIGTVAILTQNGALPVLIPELELFMGLPVVLSMAVALGTHYTRSLHELEQTHLATRRFVPFPFLEILGKEKITEIRKGDQVALEMSILFSDIRGFTTLAEALGPQQTFSLINRYLAHMEPAVTAEHGFISDIIGDGIMALFHENADAAVRAGIGMARALDAFNEAIAAEGMEPLRMGIGVNSGPLMLGTIGGKERLDCTVIGDPANLASRTEGMTKVYGAAMLITGPTRQRLEDPGAYATRLVDRVRAKGKTESVEIWEILDAEPAARRDHKLAIADLFADALEHYRTGDFHEAQTRFEQCAARAPDDAASRHYVEVCQRLREHPPRDWDGVTRLESK